MPYLLSLDQGTTSSRALVFGADGRVVAQAQEQLPVACPRPGWVEQDAGAIADTQLRCAERALSEAGLGPEDVAGVGVVNQRETTIVWERDTGRPIAPAIVWQDRRTAARCEALRGPGIEAMVRERTGLRLDPYFSATKIAWLLDEVPGARDRARRGELAFGTVDTWLIWRLTGGREHVTDVTNASRTMLFDIRGLAWDEELLEVFGVPSSLLPEVRPSAGDFGSARLGGGEIAIRGVAGDQHAALFGQGCLEPGQAKNTYGTGAFVVVNVGPEPLAGDGVLSTPAWQIGDAPPVYAMEGSIFNAGAVVQWLRDGLGLIEEAAEVEALAASVDDTQGVWFVPALTGLGAPFWKPNARGTMLGLTRGTRAGHIARAALTAIACRTRDVTDAIAAATGAPMRELRVDGGAAANDLLMQMQADVLGHSVLRPAQTETTALGAAYLAGIAAGELAPETPARSWRCERRFDPVVQAQSRERDYARWRRACGYAAGWDEGSTE